MRIDFINVNDMCISLFLKVETESRPFHSPFPLLDDRKRERDSDPIQKEREKFLKRKYHTIESLIPPFRYLFKLYLSVLSFSIPILPPHLLHFPDILLLFLNHHHSAEHSSPSQSSL
ncbi:hypothetical protein U1Q18_011775 [Sarracenia purpurea var. burkii]